MNAPLFELLCHCARTNLEEPDVERVRRLASFADVWRRLYPLAEYHGVRPMVAHNLCRYLPDTLTEDDRAQITYHARATASFNLFLSKELGRLMRMLETREIPSFTLKGPVLAVTAFGSLDLRAFSDLDVLIRRTDFDRVETALREEGYGPAKRLYGRQKQTMLYLNGQLPYMRGAAVFNVDLHTRLVPPGYVFSLSFDELLARSEEVMLEGERVRTMSPEDTVLNLCYHGEKNRWERLKHASDVAEMVRAHPGLNWDALLTRARQTRGQRTLLLGLLLASLLFETTLPAAVLQAVNSRGGIRQRAEYLAQRLPEQMHLGIAGFRERFGFHLAQRDHLRDRLQYCLYAIARRAMGAHH